MRASLCRVRASSLLFALVSLVQGLPAQSADTVPRPPPAGAVAAQDSTEAQHRAVLAGVRRLLRAYRTYSPGVNSNIPNGFGLRPGDVAVGAGIQARARDSDEPDGALHAMVGLPAPAGVGVDLGVSILDLTHRVGGGGFARRGSFKAKVHRQFGDGFGVAAGVSHALAWGETDTPGNGYLVASRVADTPGRPGDRAVLVTAGARVEEGLGEVQGLGSLTWGPARPLNLIVEWSGDALSVGGSLAPLPDLPLVLTPMLADMAGPGGDGPRFVFFVGFRASLAREPRRPRREP